MSLVRSIVIREISRKFNLQLNADLDVDKNPAAKYHWHGIVCVSQDVDELSEFLHKYNITLQRPLQYFLPTNQWAYIAVPKIQLFWAGRARASGPLLYNNLRYTAVPVEWSDAASGYMIRALSIPSTVAVIRTASLRPNKSATFLLVPETLVDRVSDSEKVRPVRMGHQGLRCVYGLVHTRVRVTKSGIYCNKKVQHGELVDPPTVITDQHISDTTAVLKGPFELSIADDRNVQFTVKSAS